MFVLESLNNHNFLFTRVLGCVNYNNGSDHEFE